MFFKLRYFAPPKALIAARAMSDGEVVAVMAGAAVALAEFELPGEAEAGGEDCCALVTTAIDNESAAITASVNLFFIKIYSFQKSGGFSLKSSVARLKCEANRKFYAAIACVRA